MLNSITLSKFKAFNEKQNATLRPITLIYGPNSAGKSSLMQSLLLLKQSTNEYGIDDTALITKGKLIDLGNYQEMVHGHNNKNKIIISNSFFIEKATRRLLRNWSRFIKSVTYESAFSCDESRHINLDCINLYYNDINEPFIILEKNENTRRMLTSNKRITRIIKRPNRSSYCIKYINKNHPLFQEMYNSIKEPNTNIRRASKTIDTKNIDEFYNVLLENMNMIDIEVDGFLITSVGIAVDRSTRKQMEMTFDLECLQIDDLILGTAVNYNIILESITYLGPLRDYPERHYIFSGVSPTSVGKSGKYTTDLLFLNQTLIDKVNEWLDIFKIDYKMVINSLNDNEISDVYSMRLFDKKNNVSVSPLDVGFGISQILPIIVQSLISKNSIICIEQPEIHIHPRLQTIFGSFITDCIKEGNQFIIETHSEHIMLRLQKLIKEGKLKKEDVSVLYIDRKENGSACIELRLDDEGDFLDEWPDGFFEEGYKEVFF